VNQSKTQIRITTARHGAIPFFFCLVSILILGCVVPDKTDKDGVEKIEREADKKVKKVTCDRCKHQIRAEKKPFVTPDKLHEFMTNKLNPDITWISFKLFHAEDEAEGSPFLEIASRSSNLAKNALSLTKMVKGENKASKRFRNFTYQLRNASESLKDAALSRDEEKTKHWFWHLTDMCLKCHVEFRGY
jgi:hypothetical protein